MVEQKAPRSVSVRRAIDESASVVAGYGMVSLMSEVERVTEMAASAYLPQVGVKNKLKEGAFCGAVQMCGKRCKNEQVKGIDDVFDTAEHREIRSATCFAELRCRTLTVSV